MVYSCDNSLILATFHIKIVIRDFMNKVDRFKKGDMLYERNTDYVYVIRYNWLVLGDTLCINMSEETN